MQAMDYDAGEGITDYYVDPIADGYWRGVSWQCKFCGYAGGSQCECPEFDDDEEDEVVALETEARAEEKEAETTYDSCNEELACCSEEEFNETLRAEEKHSPKQQVVQSGRIQELHP